MRLGPCPFQLELHKFPKPRSHKALYALDSRSPVNDFQELFLATRVNHTFRCHLLQEPVKKSSEAIFKKLKPYEIHLNLWF